MTNYNLTSPVIAYFGKETVERAIADWFLEGGVTVERHTELRTMSTKAPEDFFEMVSKYVENS